MFGPKKFSLVMVLIALLLLIASVSVHALNGSDKASDFDYYKVILPPTGNDYGGMKVNENFSCFLQKIVQDPDFWQI